jgi:glycosyl transferase family 1
VNVHHVDGGRVDPVQSHRRTEEPSNGTAPGAGRGECHMPVATNLRLGGEREHRDLVTAIGEPVRQVMDEQLDSAGLSIRFGKSRVVKADPHREPDGSNGDRRGLPVGIANGRPPLCPRCDSPRMAIAEVKRPFANGGRRSGHRVMCFATGSDWEERRILDLLAPLGPELISFDRSRKIASGWRLLRRLRDGRPDLVVMEGTGVAGGLPVIATSLTRGVPYVVSSGDAIAPFVGAVRPSLRPAAAAYERLLYTHCAGFIGWTPYLVGRALTLGAARGMTAPNWASPRDSSGPDRDAVRRTLGVPETAIAFGLVGAITWMGASGYCYGLELVRALTRTAREDVYVLIIGDGSGMDALRREAGPLLGSRVLLTGRVAPEALQSYLAALDVACLPQSVDAVGSFRYTTKLSEYLAAGLPVVTSQVPLAYDLDEGWLWRLPGNAPWDERYVESLARLMERMTPAEISARRARILATPRLFDRDRQQQAAVAFVHDLLEARGPRRP